MSSRTSFGRATSSARTAGDSVSGRVAATISCSARVIRPRPIRTRPNAPTPLFWREMKTTTPTKIRSGESHDRSSENTTAMRLVPTSAPSITASAALVVTRFLPTKEATIRQVAVLDCTRLVTPSPAIRARKRLPKLCARIAAQVLAEHPQHAGADDVRAPDEQGDRGEEIEEVDQLGGVVPVGFGRSVGQST